MAGAYGAAIAAAASTSSSVSPAISSAPVPRKSVVVVSSLPSSFSSRRRRTNHLRQKILKTLESKPYPDTSHSEFHRKTTTISIKETVQQQPSDAGQFSSSETTGFVNDIVGNFSARSFAKIGLYLVVAFIFQTICAVLIFGANDLDDEDENSKIDDYKKKARALDLGVTGNSEWKLKSNSSLNLMESQEGGMVLVDESELNNRITEIQEMAREARQQEKLDAKRKGLVEEGDDDVDYDLIDKTVKEREVDGRLMKLRKSLEGNYEKLPNNFPKKEVDVRNNGDKSISAAGEAFGPLMFKKKYKYKSPSIDSGDKPKGFDGTEDRYVANGKLINGITADDGKLKMDKKNEGSEQIDLPNGNGSGISITRDDIIEQEQIGESMPISDSENTLVNSNDRTKPRVTKAESKYGTSKEPKYDKQDATTGKSSNLEMRKPRGFSKESHSNATMSMEHGDSNRKNSLKGKKSGNRKSVKSLKSGIQTNFWWTSLPYVLAVLMQRGGNDEESEGLFTLRSTSQSKSELSHTVAFEDRGDATNFCYLLESFFQDLGDFSTNIIPIPTNELEEAVKSQIMKVVVVKKGQLQLYVGQPLTDVESTLRTLIEQNDKL